MPDPKLEQQRQRGVAATAGAEVQDIRSQALGLEKKKVSGLAPAKKKRPQGGYQAQQFQEKADIAMQQRREMAAEKGLLGRVLKGKGRADFSQRRQRVFAKVAHKARVASTSYRGSPITLHRGGARRMGTMARRTAPKARDPFGRGKPTSGNIQTGQTSKVVQEGIRSRSMSAGGMRHVGQAQVWRTTGYKKTEPGQDRSYRVGASARADIPQRRSLVPEGSIGVGAHARQDPLKYKGRRVEARAIVHQKHLENRQLMADRLREKQLRIGNYGNQASAMEDWLDKRATMMGTGRPIDRKHGKKPTASKDRFSPEKGGWK